jgi:myosin heavy subunit
MKSRGLIIIAAILALLALLAGWWGLGQKKERQALAEQNEMLNSSLNDLQVLKQDLAEEVDSLLIAYESLAEENTALAGSLAEVESRLAQKDAALRSSKNQNANEVNNLRAEIQELLATKAQLEETIYAIKEENDSLRNVTGRLEADLTEVRADNAALNKMNNTIQDELKKLTLANFKATAFQVEAERRSSKATAKSGRTRRIKVTFDLTNVPAEYQGTRPLYLVITNENGVPIASDNPLQTQSVVGGQRMDLIAQEAKEVNVGDSQRLSFSHDLSEKLDRGFYRASVFTDIGLLGAASFRLQ